MGQMLAKGDTTWAPEDDAALARMWLSGSTASQIATEIGKTKNAVIGRAHRLGLDKRREAIVPRSKPGTGCRWIEGDPREYRRKGEAIYCNAPRQGMTAWCPVHHARVYPPRVR